MAMELNENYFTGPHTCFKCGDSIYLNRSSGKILWEKTDVGVVRHVCNSSLTTVNKENIIQETKEYEQRANKELEKRDMNRRKRKENLERQKKEDIEFARLRGVDKYAKYRVPKKDEQQPEVFTCRYCKKENVYLIKNRKYEKTGTTYTNHKCETSTRMSYK